MDIFIKTVAGVILSIVLCLTLAKQAKDIAAVLTVIVCCAVVAVAMSYIEPVIDFVRELEEIGNLNGQLVTILLKAVGIGLLAEITSLICVDAGNASVGKSIQLLAAAVILWISIPLLKELLKLLESTLGAA